MLNPSIRNKAVVVVGDVEKRHGIVLAKNYVAKGYGIKTGDTVWEAKNKCLEGLVTVPTHFDMYYKISGMVKDIYREYSDRVESFGIDEAWIDISERVHSFDEAEKLAHTIRLRVLEEFGVTVSIGVSFNKVFAKLGSDYKKPNAVTTITPDNYKDIVWPLPAEDLIMVGRQTKAKLNKNNIFTIGDISTAGRPFLKRLLGKNGESIFEYASGLDSSEVRLSSDSAEIKSVGNSTTCPRDLTKDDEVQSIIYILAENVAKRMRAKNLWCNEVSITIKNSKLESIDRQKKLEYPTNLAGDIAKVAFEIFKAEYDWSDTVRLIGVRASGICSEPMQYNFLVDENNMMRKQKLEEAVETLRRRYGYKVITRACVKGDVDFADIDPTETRFSIHPESFMKK
jgi:DNA polymerase-4